MNTTKTMTASEMLTVATELLPTGTGPYKSHQLWFSEGKLHLLIHYCGHKFDIATDSPPEWEALDRDAFKQLLLPHIERVKTELYPAIAKEEAEIVSEILERHGTERLPTPA